MSLLDYMSDVPSHKPQMLPFSICYVLARTATAVAVLGFSNYQTCLFSDLEVVLGLCSHQAVVRQSSDSCQAVVKQLSGSH